MQISPSLNKREEYTTEEIIKLYPGLSSQFDYAIVVILQDILNDMNAVTEYGQNGIHFIDNKNLTYSLAEILIEAEKIYLDQLNI
ncbi:MAG: hypothetical protein CMQ41_07985 [Gammaproteobacteria bacterium]|nr:hypothetical protein [Gammaproteobacteria bacterium]|tara:strand:- start:148 stop:402 length:255 start_codon:yes stop_codon:yes gene_type:complete